MIRDFANPQTARLAAGQRNRRWPPDMQWRIVFTPNDDGSMSHVEVTDYH